MKFVITVTLWSAEEFTVTTSNLEAALLQIEGAWGDALSGYSVRAA